MGPRHNNWLRFIFDRLIRSPGDTALSQVECLHSVSRPTQWLQTRSKRELSQRTKPSPWRALPSPTPLNRFLGWFSPSVSAENKDTALTRPLTPADLETIRAVERLLGYSFSDVSLCHQALLRPFGRLYRSRRMALLGDAISRAVLVEYWYQRPELGGSEWSSRAFVPIKAD